VEDRKMERGREGGREVEERRGEGRRGEDKEEVKGEERKSVDWKKRKRERRRRRREWRERKRVIGKDGKLQNSYLKLKIQIRSSKPTSHFILNL
jgi:hypothetical protein